MGDEGAMNGVEHVLQDPVNLQAQLYTWDFDVFKLERQSGGQALYSIAMALLEDHELLDGWKLVAPVCKAYFSKVQALYKANPYHNNTHAADVTQTSGVILTALDSQLSSSSSSSSADSTPCCSPNCSSSRQDSNNHARGSSNIGGSGGAGGQLGAGMSKLEKFAVIFASIVHDLAHPGVNNYYLRETFAPMSLTYNDRSVNENMHVSMAFKLAAEDPSLNIFANFTREEYKLVRKYVMDMVLSTDMDVHFKLLGDYAAQLKQQPDVRKWEGVEQRSLLFQMLVHLADLANPARPWPLALKWAEMVVTEFLAQGEKEAAAGIPVSPPCNRDTVCMPKAQLFFIDNFMAPTLEAFRSAAPAFYSMAHAWLQDTQAKWQVFLAAGVRFPHQGYPQLPSPPADQQQLRTTLPGIEGCRKCKGPAGHKQPAAAVAGAAAPQQQPCKLTGDPPQQQQQHHQQQPALPQATQQTAAQAAG